MTTATPRARRAPRSRAALPALVAVVAIAAASVTGAAAPASANDASIVTAPTATDESSTPEGPVTTEQPSESDGSTASEPVEDAPAVVPIPPVDSAAAEVSDQAADRIPGAPAADARAETAPENPAEMQILATEITMQSYTGGTVRTVNAGETFEQGNTVSNVGPVGVPANTARLHYRADNGLIIASANLRNVGVNGTRTRACARTDGGAGLECLTQSNWNAIGPSTTGNRYSNFYTSVRIPADAVPGTTYALHYSFDFDPAVYTNVNPLTSATWFYRVAVPAPVIDVPSAPVGPIAPITGSGVPGATVYLSLYGGAALGTAVVGDDGRWSILPSTPLTHGMNSLAAYQHSVDADSATNGGIVLVDAQVDPPAVAAPEGEQDLTGPLELTGEGEPGATVEVRDESGTVVCSTVVETGGTWACVIPALDDRDQELSVTQTDRVGNVSTSVPVAIIATPAPGPQPGDGTEPEPGPQPGDGSTPEAGPQPASGTAADPSSPSDASAPLTAPARAAALAATGGEVDGILLGAGGLLLVAGILSLAIPRRRVQ
ncbi:Ig-like domain-containing protein [Microbacterium sp. 22215]|uniref:Ig-like domain-containing protein n=1 Tax=Microbacterium sp. 22215 TaxID=3453893 RepID=UPI003F87474E